MKIMVLEDSQARIDFFREKLVAHEAYYFTTVADAIQFISNNAIDMAFLDHDLEQHHGVESDRPDAGYQFVKYFTDKELAKNALFIIHSMNPVGAQNMYALLKEHDYFVEKIPYNLIRENK